MATNISTITINAPAIKVWQILTNPEKVKQWQYGSELSTTWEAGSAIRFRTAWQDKVFEQWGTVLETVPLRLIKYSLFAPRPGLEDKPENYFIMTYQLSGTDTDTRLDIIQEDNRPGAKQEEPQGEENPILQALKKLAEAGI